jgi:hypothetical protein
MLKQAKSKQTIGSLKLFVGVVVLLLNNNLRVCDRYVHGIHPKERLGIPSATPRAGEASMSANTTSLNGDFQQPLAHPNFPTPKTKDTPGSGSYVGPGHQQAQARKEEGLWFRCWPCFSIQ